jgi:hypothetical protein
VLLQGSRGPKEPGYDNRTDVQTVVLHVGKFKGAYHLEWTWSSKPLLSVIRRITWFIITPVGFSRELIRRLTFACTT